MTDAPPEPDMMKDLTMVIELCEVPEMSGDIRRTVAILWPNKAYHSRMVKPRGRQSNHTRS